MLAPTEEAVRIADLYIAEKIRTDGLHIAIATVNDLEMIISMNFQHIVKRKTKIGTANTNALNRYRSAEIYSPMEVVENEEVVEVEILHQFLVADVLHVLDALQRKDDVHR